MKRKIFCTLLLLFVCFTAAHAQDVRASITGIVSDPSGAPVAGATINVTNLATNVAVSSQTNETGNYVTPFLAPGQYKLAVEKTGFKRYMRENVLLQAQNRARVDVTLELGELAQSVTISDSVSQLQTETASRSQTLANELVENIPTQGRNPFQIAWATAGVTKSGNWRYLRSFDIGGTSGVSINGGREKENEVLMDGISNVRGNRTVIGVPTTESVQEFKVQTSTYDAQYGRTGGGVITIVTKGGGNEFHGTAFEYFQNDKLNANQSELNKARTKRPPNHINQFGAQASGPIYIPKVFNGKNRAFWMLSWESMRQRSADPGSTSVPLDVWRTGDFRTLYNNAGVQITLYDPWSTQSNGTRTPIANNTIPSASIDPVAKAALGYYPSPRSAGDGPAHNNNYIYPSRWIASFDQFVGRTDVAVNQNNNVYFRYSENPFQEYRNITFAMDNPAEPTGNAPLLRNGRNIGIDWTSTISPTMTFNLRFGLSRWEEAGGSTIGANFDPTKLGIGKDLAGQFLKYQFPRFDMDGYQSIGADAYGPAAMDTYSLQPNFNVVMGKHFIKVGAEARRYNRNENGRGYPSGYWSFNKAWTQANASKADAVSGNSLASMLLGVPASARVEKNVDPAYVHYYYAGFVHDDWKITPKLTLNFGLRWDMETANFERFNRNVLGLDFDAASPIAASVSGLDLKGRVLFANLDGQPREAFQHDKNNWQPRVGLAYRLRDKWVLRGGYGLYYLGQDETGWTGGFSRTTTAVTSLNSLTPYPGISIANTYVSYGGTLLNPIGSSKGAASFLGEGVTANFLDRPMPYSHQYSFDIQRELPGDFLFEIGYSGNTGRKLPVGFSLNYIPADKLGVRTSSGAIDTAYYTTKVANPMTGLIPNNASLNAATVNRPILWYSFPQFTQVTLNNVPIGLQQYHGMQVKVTKRMSNGLSFLASYGIGKNLTQTSVLNAQDFSLSNWEDTKLEKRSDQNIDAPQKFVIVGLYELPFGKGRKYGSSMHPVLNGIIGGWQINWDLMFQSGWVVDYPNAKQLRPGSAKLPAGERTLYRWFDTSLWQTSSGTMTSAKESYTLQDFPSLFSDVRRPGYKNLDASVSKLFPIKENVKLQFRFEMVNAANHPWFANMASTDVTNSAFGQLNPTQRNLPRFLKLVMHLNW